MDQLHSDQRLFGAVVPRRGARVGARGVVLLVPYFRKNTLGTCKHIIYALRTMRRRFPAAKRNTPFVRRGISVHLSYGAEVELRMALPPRLEPGAEEIVSPIRGRAITNLPDLLKRIRLLEQQGSSVTIYPDAEDYIEQRMLADRLAARAAEIRRDPAGHPLRSTLLKAELLPYQLDGIAFSAGAGRAILAEDMGLGKTVQAIGLAKLLAREAGSRKLVVCPASMKSQWRSEIERFSGRDPQIVVNPLLESGFTVYACARPGRGETDLAEGDTLEDEAMDVTNLIRFMALAAAAQTRDHIRKLVLYEPPDPRPVSEGAVTRLQELRAVPLLESEGR